MVEIESVVEILKKVVKEKDYQEPVRKHELIYDSSSDGLEPVYFWILDLMNSFFSGKVEKLVDNFISSPGSGHFSELSGKRSIMQKNVTESMGTINTVIKSIINIIYDLKDFEIRLEHYEAAKSDDKNKKEAGMLALKQIWMDNVDIKRGQGALHAMAQNLNFVTARDAFYVVNSVDEVQKLDLNDRVKRLLKPRIAEFLKWKELSEKEIQKRFAVEKNYLKSQVNMLQLYSRWVKPYLKSAQQLEMQGAEKSPELVTTFNTIVLELTIFGKNLINVKEESRIANLPQQLKKPKREYYSVVMIDFHFRGIPQKAGQHYVFGGRTTVNFQAYSLNDEELKALTQELKKSDMEEVLKLIEGSTTESIDQLQEDIDHFLKEKEGLHQEQEKPQDTNPFSALFSPLFKKKQKSEPKPKKEVDIKKIKKDSYAEALIRKLAADKAEDVCFKIFDVYKKAHGMASHDDPFE